MALFDIKRNTKAQDTIIAKKSNKRATNVVTVKRDGLLGRINEIIATLDSYIGKYKDLCEVISTTERLNEYIGNCIRNGIVAIDTETTGLNPLVDKCVGISLYTLNEKWVYIPINHVSYITGVRSEGQLTEEQVRKAFAVLTLNKASVDIIMFNANFDIRVLRNQVGIEDIYCTWDCCLASKLLNENEESGGLKALHKKYVLDGKEDEFRFDELFNGITFDKVPINPGYLYAARDAIITYELYQFQKPYLDPENELCREYELQDVSWVFHNIEMPCVEVVTRMEDTGVDFDLEYNKQLKEKYHNLLNERLQEFYNVCDMYKDEIEEYRLKMGTKCKLEDPINIKSSSQLAILLYDIVKCDAPIDKKTKLTKRTTNEDTLVALDNPVAKAILNYREFSTIVDTFIDKLPECVHKDGRIHCNFNQYGARTGRFSSSDPNLQNIPSHNKEIRKMFKATDGYVLMSSDYSQQEPKVMTQMCGDPKMIQAYQEGKDLYAEIAALSFNTTYDNCLEFRPDGTTNPEGKNRRSQAKSILLGVLYGRGVPSIAEQLGTSTKKAQAIKDSVFKGFPAIPEFEEASTQMAIEEGYVTTLWGRKRRLPEMQLPEYEFKWIDGAPKDDDPLAFDVEVDELGLPVPQSLEVPEDIQRKYLKRLKNCWGKQKRGIFEEANKEGIWIIDNGMKIADAQRQCVNARIQGSAADMSKLAMIAVGNDKRLKELGFRLLIQVHDELIGECPEENAKECAERFAVLMSEAAGDKLTIPIKCDVSITKEWYGDELKFD